MKRATLTAAAAVFAGILTAAPVQQANQPWVLHKIDEVVGTNTAAKIAAASNNVLTASKSYTDAAIAGVGGLTPEAATNAAEAVVQRDVPAWARAENPPESMTDNAVVLTNNALKTKGGTAVTAAHIGARSASDQSFTNLRIDNGYGRYFLLGSQFASSYLPEFLLYDWAQIKRKTGTAGQSDESLPTWVDGRITSAVPAWSRAATKPTYTAAEVTGAQTAANVATAIANAGHMTQTAANQAYYPKASGDAWSTYWDGDDVRVTVTNYDSVAHLPSLYLEQRTNQVAQATNHFRIVWREMAHWEKFLGAGWDWDAQWAGFKSWTTNITAQLSEKADRAWGFFDSHTGNYAPDGYTSISSSNILLSAGMSYQKRVTTSAEVWVLTANEPYEPTGVSTNGGFQIRDSDGNVQFEIIKGDKVTVPAQAGAVTVENNTTLVVTYNIISGSHPDGSVCLGLEAADWKAEGAATCPATVVWSGSSGAWVARITPKQATTKCFFKATYQRGGDTYINNRCAVGMSQIVINGTTYNLGTAVISGNTVLTLTPAN